MKMYSIWKNIEFWPKKMGFWAIVPRTDIRRVANIYIDLHVYKLILGLDTVQSIQMIRSIYIQGGPQKMQKLNE